MDVQEIIPAAEVVILFNGEQVAGAALLPVSAFSGALVAKIHPDVEVASVVDVLTEVVAAFAGGTFEVNSAEDLLNQVAEILENEQVDEENPDHPF